MLLDGIVLGTMSVAGGYLLWRKMPPRARAMAIKYNLTTDIVVSLGVYFLIAPGTVTGITAAAWAGILTSMLLHVAAHPDEYAWMSEGIEEAKKGCGSLLGAVKEAVASGKATDVARSN